MQETSGVDKVLVVLREFAGEVGQTAETLWPMAVQATWAQSLTYLIIGCCVSLTGLAALTVLIKNRKSIEDQVGWTIGVILSGLTSLVSLSIGMAEGLPGVISPEGVTLLKLLG